MILVGSINLFLIASVIHEINAIGSPRMMKLKNHTSLKQPSKQSEDEFVSLMIKESKDRQVKKNKESGVGISKNGNVATTKPLPIKTKAKSSTITTTTSPIKTKAKSSTTTTVTSSQPKPKISSSIKPINLLKNIDDTTFENGNTGHWTGFCGSPSISKRAHAGQYSLYYPSSQRKQGIWCAPYIKFPKGMKCNTEYRLTMWVATDIHWKRKSSKQNRIGHHSHFLLAIKKNGVAGRCHFKSSSEFMWVRQKAKKIFF
jgi:hypothetical protein